ncbi:MAG: signal transduction histidine kinase [Candidatus Azotimanducaceae bacterium]|jgi:signal transduction histidine kinase
MVSPFSTRIVKENRERRNVLICLSTVIAVCLFFGLRAWQWEIWVRLWTLGFAMTCCLSVLWVHRRHGVSKHSSDLAIIGMAVAVFGAAYTSGGITSFGTMWLLVLPLTGGLVGNKAGALTGILSSVVCLCVLFVLELVYGQLPNLTPLDFQLGQDRLHQLGTLLVVGVCSYSFLNSVAIADTELDANVDTLEREVDARKAAEHEARQANQAKSEFLARIIHEIRTPMNGVLGMLNLLQTNKMNSEQSDYFNTAYSSGEALLTVLNDILVFSKLESGNFETEPVEFNLRELFEDVAGLFASLARAKGLELVSIIPSDVSECAVGDPARLRQLISNLLSNAIKFTATGEVVLRVRNNKSEPGSTVPIGCLIFEVSDTGIGVDADRQALIFGSFEQNDGSTTRLYGGAGLGLSISKGLVEIMGGEIGIHSVPDQGSTFWFSLPFVPPGI